MLGIRLGIFAAAMFYMVTATAVPSLLGGQEPIIYKQSSDSSIGVTTSTVQSRAASLAPSSYPATVNAIVIKVDFPADTDSTTTGTGVWTDPAYNDTGLGADYWLTQIQTQLPSYYQQVSYNNLTLNLTVDPTVYHMQHTMAYYGAETAASIENLIYDAVTAADPDVNFQNYQAIFIVHAGPGEETDVNGDSPGDIWSLYYHDTQISPGDSSSTPTLVADGVTIQDAVIMPQTDSQDGITVDPLGVFAHEFGHWLGLPDLYATGLFGPSWDGIGDWGLMSYGMYARATPTSPLGSGPAQMCAWSKVYLGWVTPTVVDPNTDPGALNLLPVETNPSIIKIPNSDDGTKYYLLENRQQASSTYDNGLPGSGLLVWQIDDSIISSNMSSNTVNTSAANPGVKLIEADGDNALLTYGGDQGSAGDPFPGTSGNTAFTPWTTPGSANAGQNGWLYLTNMAQNGDGSISYSLAFSPRTPSNVTEDQSLSEGLKLTWNASAASDFAYYNVYIGTKLFTHVNRNQFKTSPVLANKDFHVSAVDTSGHESGILNQPSINKDLRCFIATAAYGSPFEPYVALLRKFRDRFLLTNNIGKIFVATYYKLSPPFAHFISEHSVLRGIVRVLLLPLIIFAWLAMHLGFGATTALMVLLLFSLIWLFRKTKYLITAA